MKETWLNPKYTEIQELFKYCVKLGIDARLERFFDGYAIRFPNGDDFEQHEGSCGSSFGYVEPAISCRRDYTPVSLIMAKALVRYNKDRLNRRV